MLSSGFVTYGNLAPSQDSKFVPFRSSTSLKDGGFLRQAKTLHMTAFQLHQNLIFLNVRERVIIDFAATHNICIDIYSYLPSHMYI